MSRIEASKIEIPVGFKIGEIANTASVLIDELTKTRVEGTQVWPFFKGPWLTRIRGERDRVSGRVIKRFDMRARGLRVGYRGYIDNLIHMERRGLSVLLDEPKLLVFTDEELLSPSEMVDVSYIVNLVRSRYDLREEPPPTFLVFPKETYATEVVVFDAGYLNIH